MMIFVLSLKRKQNKLERSYADSLFDGRLLFQGFHSWPTAIKLFTSVIYECS